MKELLQTEQITLNGADVIARAKDAIYIRIPPELAKAIDGGCVCDYCKANPHLTPKWDTLSVPTQAKYNYVSTVHMPDAESFRAYLARKAVEAGGAR